MPFANPTNNPFIYSDAPTHPFLISQGINETTDYRIIMVRERERGREGGVGRGGVGTADYRIIMVREEEGAGGEGSGAQQGGGGRGRITAGYQWDDRLSHMA